MANVRKHGIKKGSQQGSTELKAASSFVMYVEYETEELNSQNVLAFVATVRPLTLDGKPFAYYTYEAISDPEGRPSIWEVTCVYQLQSFGRPVGQAGDKESSLNTIGGSARITDAIQRLTAIRASDNSPIADSGLAVGVTDRGVEGVDIPVSAFDFTLTDWIPKATATVEFRNKIKNLSARVNSQPYTVRDFGSFAAGELLFRGASITTQRDSDVVQVTYQFSSIKNDPTFSRGGVTIEGGKKGWHYLWYQHEESNVEGLQTRKVVAAYVDQVIEEADFSTLPVLT